MLGLDCLGDLLEAGGVAIRDTVQDPPRRSQSAAIIPGNGIVGKGIDIVELLCYLINIII